MLSSHYKKCERCGQVIPVGPVTCGFCGFNSFLLESLPSLPSPVIEGEEEGSIKGPYQRRHSDSKPEEVLMENQQTAMDTQVGGAHYKKHVIQPAEYCQKNKLNWCESNVVAYVTRHRDKGGKEDILKSIHYLEMLLEMEYPEGDF